MVEAEVVNEPLPNDYQDVDPAMDWKMIGVMFLLVVVGVTLAIVIAQRVS